MTSKIKILRSDTAGRRPTGKTSGESYVNFADLQFGVVNTAGNNIDLIAIRKFSALSSYSIGDLVVNSGAILRAKIAVPAGAFNAANWENLNTLKDLNDTDLSSPAHEGDALVWSAALSKWTHGAPTPYLENWVNTKRYFSGTLVYNKGRFWTATKISTNVEPNLVNGNIHVFTQDAGGANIGPIIPAGIGATMGVTPSLKNVTLKMAATPPVAADQPAPPPPPLSWSVTRQPAVPT
jgi:hypothetical protein